MEESKNNVTQAQRGTFPRKPEASASEHFNPNAGAEDYAQLAEAGVAASPEASAVGRVESHGSDEQTKRYEPKTYIKLETKGQGGGVTGVIEIDLISYREKGEESRYLSVSTVGVNSSGEPSNTFISIDNEADFNRLKMFISDLNWND